MSRTVNSKGDRTVIVAVPLRVPRSVMKEEIKDFVRTALKAEPGSRDPEDPCHHIRVLGSRVEVLP